VVTQEPEIAGRGNRRPLGHLRELVVIGIARLLGAQAVNQTIDIRDRESRDLNVELGIQADEVLEFLREDLVVPGGIER
jgi:hypothetical protein